MALSGSSIPLDDTCTKFAVTYICPNRGSWEALKIAADRITPSAFEPGIPEATAKLMQRDGVIQRAPDSLDSQPPPCDGHHATEAPMPPHLAGYLDGREDDTGKPYDVSSDPAYAVGLTESDDEVGA